MEKLHLADAARLKQLLSLQEIVQASSKDPATFLERCCQATAHSLRKPAAAISQPVHGSWKIAAYYGGRDDREALAAATRAAPVENSQRQLPATMVINTAHHGPSRVLLLPFAGSKLLALLSPTLKELTSDELWSADCLATLLGASFTQISARSQLAASERQALEAVVAMAHDLRSSLNAIIGYTSLLREDAYGPLGEKQKEVLSSMEGQAVTLLLLFHGALDLARVEALDHTSPRETVSLSEILGNLLSATRARVNSKHLSIAWSVAPDVPLLVLNKGHLQHVLQNLVDNALRATEKGTISVTATYSAAWERVEVTVTDTGRGIDPADIPGLFELFRIGGTGKRHPGNHGCGLYLVGRFCEKLGAKIKVESKPGKGSSFTVELPAHPRAESAPSAVTREVS